MKRILAAAGATFWLLSCGAGPSAETPKPEATAKPDALPRRAAGKTPTPEIAKLWAFEGEPESAIFLDAEGLQTTELWKNARSALLAALRDFDPCAKDLIGGTREVLAGSLEGRGFVVIRVDPALKVAPCLEKLHAMGDQQRVDGAETAYLDGEALVAINPGYVVAGDPELVRNALAAKKSYPTPPLELGKNQYLAAKFTQPEARLTGRAIVVAAADKFQAELTADMPDRVADVVEKQATRPPEQLAELFKLFRFKREKGNIALGVEIVGPPEKQAKELTTMIETGARAFTAYLLKAKQEEARALCGMIAKSIVQWWEREDPKVPRAKRKLTSYPPVPKEVRKGIAVVPTEADWEPWKALRFAPQLPQRYQVQVKAAKDGESAQIIAHGDLNGDGKVSTFKALLMIDRKQDVVVIGPAISEENPDE